MKRSVIVTELLAVAVVLIGAVVAPQCLYAQCIPPPSGMVAWWPLDEMVGTTSNDIAGNVNNYGTWVGGPVPGAGVVGGALSFNGLNSVDVPDHPELNFGIGDFSIDLWIQTTDASGTRTILDKRTGSLPYVTGYSLYLWNGNPGLHLGDGAGYTNWNSTAFVADGNWHHVAVTVDRSNTSGLLFYVDGNLVSTFDPTGRQLTLTNTAPFVMARNLITPSYTIVGTLDELELFNGVLGPGTIESIWLAGDFGKCRCATPPTGLDNWWPLDEMVGTTSNDIAGANNAGNHVGGPTAVGGKVEAALRFSGSNSVSVSNDPEVNVGTGDFSIDLWIQTVDSLSVATLIDKRTGSSSNPTGYALFLSGGYLGSQIGDGTNYNNWVSTMKVADGDWHHVALTVDRNNPTGWLHYVDGNVVGPPGNPTLYGNLDNTASLVMAQDQIMSSHSFAGTLDEVELIKRVLDPSEIHSIWAADSLGKCKAMGRIEGTKWGDMYPYNCTQDLGEPELAGWTINLSPPAPSGPTCVTDLQGNYVFDFLQPGTYTVYETAKPGWLQVCPPWYGVYTVTLTQWNTVIPDQDFGNDTCHADSIAINTGYNYAAGSVYSIGDQDAYWDVTCDPSGTMAPHPAFVVGTYPGWAPPQPNSQWISSAATAGQKPNGVYCFRYCFCLEPGYTYAELSFGVRADDSAAVYLNGFFVGAAPDGTWSPSLNPTSMFVSTTTNPTYFQDGVNCITVRVSNLHGVAMGLNVQGLVLSHPAAVITPECCDRDCCDCPTMGNIDESPDCLVTMSDLTILIDYLFISLTPLPCPEAANVDLSPDGLITMSDLTILIDHLFITLTPLPPCP